MSRTEPTAPHNDGTTGERAGNATSGASANADQPLRQSGIRVVGEVPWGSHICIFYETKDDLLDTAAAYFKAGLEGNEFCVWAISEPITEADAKTVLQSATPDLEAQLAAGRIEIIQGTDWYLRGNEFDLQRITGGWSEKLRGALARGFDGMRVSGNAFWIESNHWQAFCEYEHELDRSLAGQRMVVLCTYSLQVSRAVDLLDVARAHNCCTARRNGDWEFLATPELRLQQRGGPRARHQPPHRRVPQGQRDAQAGRQEHRRSRAPGARRCRVRYSVNRSRKSGPEVNLDSGSRGCR